MLLPVLLISTKSTAQSVDASKSASTASAFENFYSSLELRHYTDNRAVAEEDNYLTEQQVRFNLGLKAFEKRLDTKLTLAVIKDTNVQGMTEIRRPNWFTTYRLNEIVVFHH